MFGSRLCVALALALLVACASPEDKVTAHLDRANELMANKDLVRAKLEVRSALQIQPKNAAAHFLLAKIAWSEGDYRAAFPELQMAVEADPSLVDARLQLGQLYVAARDTQSAAAQLEAVQALAPDRAEVRLLAGRVLFLQGDMEGAAREIDAALAANPAYVDAITSKAALRGSAGDAAGALSVLDEGIARAKGSDAELLRDFRRGILKESGQLGAYEQELATLMREFPKNTKYRYELLDFYGEQGRRDDQLRVLREMVAAEPEKQGLKVRLAGALVARDDAAGAEKLLKDAIAKNPQSAELQIGLGDFYRATKRSGDALAAYERAADQWAVNTPEGLQARNRIVAQHAVDGRVAEARAGIAEILAAAPDNADALLSRATFAFLDRQYEPAIADLRMVLRREQSPEALLLLARSYVGMGDNVVAADTYRRLLEQEPTNSAAGRELALLLGDQGDRAGASAILRDLVGRRPGDSEAASALVQSLVAQGDFASAEAEARRLVEGSADRPAAQTQLARVLQAKGSTSEAIATYRAVLDQDPNQPEALGGLVSALLEAKRPGEAIAVLERYPKGDLTASLLLGNVYARQGDVAAARQLFEQAIAAHPADGRPWVALGSLSPAGSPEQARALERGWKAVPGDPTIGIFLAGNYQSRSQPDKAIEVYEAVLAKAPGSTLAINNLAALLLDQRSDPKSLARALELAKSLAGVGDAVTLDTLGWAYYRNGDFANAVSYLERAVAREPDSAQLNYHLGKAYAAAGNAVSARQHLGRALDGGSAADFAADARATLAQLGN